MGWGLNPKILASHSIQYSISGGLVGYSVTLPNSFDIEIKTYGRPASGAIEFFYATEDSTYIAITEESSLEGLKGNTVSNVTAITVYYIGDLDCEWSITFDREVPWRYGNGDYILRSNTVGDTMVHDYFWDIFIEEDVTITDFDMHIR